jgi:hypothetical protein
MLAMCCMPLAMPATATWAQVPAKSAMTVGAIVVKPCVISDRGSKNSCQNNIRKTISENSAQVVVSDTEMAGNGSIHHGSFIEYEF